jgi:ATP-binding cassette subfamily B protein
VTTRRWLDLGPLGQGIRLLWDNGRQLSLVQIGLLLVEGAVPLVTLYLVKRVVDVVAAALAGGGGAGETAGRIGLLVGLAALAAVVAAAVRSLSGLVTEMQAIRLTDRVQDMLHRKSVELDLQYYESTEYHDTLHRAQIEAPHRPTRIVGDLTQIGLGVVSLAGVLAVLVSLDWILVVVLLAAALPGLFVKARHSRGLYQWARRQTPAQRWARYFNVLLTTVEFAKEIRLFDLGAVFRDRYRAARKAVTDDRLAVVRKRIGSDLAAQVVAVSAVFGGVYLLVGRALAGTISVGDLVMYIAAFQRAQDFFRSALAGLANLYEHSLFLGDLTKFMALEPTLAEPTTPATFPSRIAQGIVFDHVTFRYPGKENIVLEDVSLEIRPGEHLALVGENGSGKTTLVKLLCRLYDPTHGTIRVDGTDLREFASHDVRGNITVLFQDYARYQLTARENIWLGNVTLPIDSDRVIDAAERTNAAQVIENLPRRYDTMLGRQLEEGTDLSIGQWQRLALARAFVRDSQLIILDEPTAALDPKAEAEVFERFHELARGRTAILISHRLSTVKQADRILVLSEGRVVEVGAHDDLVERGGIYARLFETQAGLYR